MRRGEELACAIDKPLHVGRDGGGLHELGVNPCVESAASVAAYLQMRKLLLEVRRNRSIEEHILLERRVEHGLPFRLVPYFPVFHFHLEAVGPAFRVVADYVFADAAPLGKVLWRLRPQRRELLWIAHPVFYCHAKTKERFHFVRLKRLHERVGEYEAVVLGVVLVRIEVGEEVGDVNEETAAEPPAYVMKARIRNARLLQVVQHRPVL